MYLDATKANQGLFRAFLTPGDPVGDSRAHSLGGYYCTSRRGTSANRIPAPPAYNAWIDLEHREAYGIASGMYISLWHDRERIYPPWKHSGQRQRER